MPDNFLLVLDGVATTEVTFNYVAMNYVKVKALPINLGQCQSMDIEVMALSAEHENVSNNNGEISD